MESRIWHCVACDAECDFVQPPCIDGHTDEDGECPEWACVDCGATLMVEHLVVAASVRRAGRAA